MYLPRQFRESDLAELDRLIAEYPFATLVTVHQGAPFATHLPVLYARDGERIVCRGHWARPNPQWHDAPEALLIVHGPHAYVSPSWYPDKLEAARVPTWNYAVAHLRGPLEVLHDADALAAIVSELSERHEAESGGGWRFDPEHADQRAQLKGIVGFRLEARQVELKFKLNQNHPLANRSAVAAALAARPGDSAHALAGLMRARLDRPAAPEPSPTDPPTET